MICVLADCDNRSYIWPMNRLLFLLIPSGVMVLVFTIVLLSQYLPSSDRSEVVNFEPIARLEQFLSGSSTLAVDSVVRDCLSATPKELDYTCEPDYQTYKRALDEAISARGTSTPPSFEQYPVTTIFNGQIAPFDAEGEEYFFKPDPTATVFADVYKKYAKVNYAGKYYVQFFHCGSGCQYWAVIDVTSGKVVDFLTTGEGISHKENSRLLITNSDKRISYAWYEWSGPVEYLVINDQGEFEEVFREDFVGAGILTH